MKFTDISESRGAPFGGFGTGFFVYGHHGFVNFDLDGFPEAEQTAHYPDTDLWKYYDEDPEAAPIALFLRDGDETHLLQTRTSAFAEGIPCTDFRMDAAMPLARCGMNAGADLSVSMEIFSSVKPHDIERTSVPAAAFEITVCNRSDFAREVELGLCFDKKEFCADEKDECVLRRESGEMFFGFESGKAVERITLEAGEEKTVSAALGWYFPTFTTPGISPNDVIFRQMKIDHYDAGENQGTYTRNYTLRYSCAADAARQALREHALWKEDIIRWHESFKVPDEVSHIWFGSYASLITASLYTTEGFFFDIEQPHGCMNTMDVSVYSTWIYMVNWPEMEKRDLEQYIAAIPRTGETAGKVWHSLWADGAHYVEEATYTIRTWRYVLWSSDTEFLKKALPSVRMALEYMYRTEGIGSLINNEHGNQSYDGWMMPGVGAYVNNQWLYALFALRQMCRAAGEPEVLCGRDLNEFLSEAIKEYNDLLWDKDGGYWHTYRCNEHSIQLPFGEAIFTDQLFGHWVMMIDPESGTVLDGKCERSALEKIYRHNRITTPDGEYSCWTNGMMPDKERTVEIDMTDTEPVICGFHALVCWVGTELVFASMLSRFGLEEESRDVLSNLSRGMGKNVLAVGEFNRMLDKNGEATICFREPGKDTPRFPPYPRYKSSWEYLVTMLGMKMTLTEFSLAPVKNTDFSISGVILAGTEFDITVHSGWTRCLVNGAESEPTFPRSTEKVTLEFV